MATITDEAAHRLAELMLGHSAPVSQPILDRILDTKPFDQFTQEDWVWAITRVRELALATLMGIPWAADRNEFHPESRYAAWYVARIRAADGLRSLGRGWAAHHCRTILQVADAVQAGRCERPWPAEPEAAEGKKAAEPEWPKDESLMASALRASAWKFLEYRSHHRKKGTAESTEKAEVNEKMACTCLEAMGFDSVMVRRILADPSLLIGRTPPNA